MSSAPPPGPYVWRPRLQEEAPMRQLIVPAFVTLDGVMQAPGGPDEDPTCGFAQGGWGVNHWDETMYGAMSELLASPFDLLLGRKTYEIFAAHWPHVGEGERDERGGTASDVDDPAAAALNSARKYVASRTLDTVTWNNSVLLQGDVADAVARSRPRRAPTSSSREAAISSRRCSATISSTSSGSGRSPSSSAPVSGSSGAARRPAACGWSTRRPRVRGW
jgi:dihydrofolate reductase